MAWRIGISQKTSGGESGLQVRNRFIRLLFPLMIATFMFDRLRVRPDTAISVQRLLYVVMFSGIVMLLLIKRRLRIFPFSSELFSLLLFNIALIFSLLFALDFSVSAAAVLSIAQLSLTGVIVGIFLCNFWQARDISLLAKTVGWLTMIGSLTIITDYFGLTNFREWYIPDWPLARQMGILGEPNFAAGKLAIGLPFIVWALERSAASRRFLLITVYTIGLGLSVIAVFLTGSRMGIFMYAVLLLLITVKRRMYLTSPRIAIIIGLLVIALFWLLRGPFGEMLDLTISRMNPVWSAVVAGQELEEMSAFKRLKALEIGVLIFRDYPLFGVGMDGYRLIVGYYNLLLTDTYAHNTYIEILVGTGLLGFIPYIAFLFSVLKRLIIIRQISEINHLYFYFVLSFFMLLIHLFFLSDWSNRYMWNLFLPLSLYLECINVYHRRALWKSQ